MNFFCYVRLEGICNASNSERLEFSDFQKTVGGVVGMIYKLKREKNPCVFYLPPSLMSAAWFLALRGHEEEKVSLLSAQPLGWSSGVEMAFSVPFLWLQSFQNLKQNPPKVRFLWRDFDP